MLDCLAFLAGVFVLAVGLHCLPTDLRRPWAGGVTGVPLDVALIVFGLIMVADVAGTWTI